MTVGGARPFTLTKRTCLTVEEVIWLQIASERSKRCAQQGKLSDDLQRVQLKNNEKQGTQKQNSCLDFSCFVDCRVLYSKSENGSFNHCTVLATLRERALHQATGTNQGHVSGQSVRNCECLSNTKTVSLGIEFCFTFKEIFVGSVCCVSRSAQKLTQLLSAAFRVDLVSHVQFDGES